MVAKAAYVDCLKLCATSEDKFNTLILSEMWLFETVV